MRKPRPAPDPKFVFDPASDAAYVHFDGHQHAPFDAAATSMTRANAWWLAEAALLAYWTPADAVPRFLSAGLTAQPLGNWQHSVLITVVSPPGAMLKTQPWSAFHEPESVT